MGNKAKTFTTEIKSQPNQTTFWKEWFQTNFAGRGGKIISVKPGTIKAQLPMAERSFFATTFFATLTEQAQT